jgi:hypothetical protein
MSKITKAMMCMTVVTMMMMIASITAMADGTRMMSNKRDLATENSTKVPLGLKETKLAVVLPKPLSDFSTVYDSVNNYIFISGGCDSINGNEYNIQAGGIFTCNNISNSHYKILVNDLTDTTTSPMNVTFTRLADMPTARYRHTAVLLPNSQQILYIGGRNVVDDSILTTVDMYHIPTDTWISRNVTDDKYLLSDNTGFEYMNRAYVFGGWNGSYTAQSTSFYNLYRYCRHAHSPGGHFECRPYESHRQ